MTVISNSAPERSSLHAVKGDAIDLELFVNSELISTGRKFYVQALSAPDDGIPYTAISLQIQVRRKDGLLLKDWISGVSPSDIVIGAGSFHITDADGFGEAGFFDFDVQDSEFTIMSGTFYVEKETTVI
jgi:hypothetical protein